MTPVAEMVQFDQFMIGSDGLVYAANSERISVFDGNVWTDVRQNQRLAQRLI